MITFLTGVPGSGKSYYAVDKIYNNFSNDKEAIRDKKATFENCYTNINEFNFDKVENTFFLDFDDLKIKLTELHKLYKDKNPDEVLIEKCKEYNILNTLFVVDEAHNFFDVKDMVLVWWLSYHRHLFHEIILITQNLALIESKYKSFSEFFYKAFPQSLTLFKTHFKYNVYCSSRMSLNSKTGTVKIKRNQKVFEIYKSGDSINAQNIILKFLLIAFLFFIAVASLVYFYSESLKAPETPISTENNTSQIINSAKTSVLSVPPASTHAADNINHERSSKIDYQSSKYLSLNCNSSICYNDKLSIPVPLVTYFIKVGDLTLLYSREINKNHFKMYLSCSEDFYSFLNLEQRMIQNENKPLSNSFFNAPLSPVPAQSR